MAKVGGKLIITINGIRYPIRGDVKMSLSGYKREAVVGVDIGIHGFKEMPAVSFIECAVTDLGSLDINTINQLENVTIAAELNNGKTGVLHNATQVNQIELDAIEGQFTVRFEGNSGEYIVSGG